MRLSFLCTLFAAAPAAADDAQVARVVTKAKAGVVAVIVSQNPRHLAVPAAAPPPLKLGPYPSLGEFGRAGRGDWDARLDLANPENAADYTLGSGVVLSADGLVLTNYHLIDGARKIYVRGSTGAGSYADIHAADARSDLAVLRLLAPPPGMAPVPLAAVRTGPGPDGEPATVAAGEAVVSLGHPSPAAAADGVPTVASGVLAGVRRRVPAAPASADEGRAKPLHQFSVLLQTDARTTQACAGAALLNTAGELIGLATPTAALTGADAGGGFAVPMDPNYRRIVAALKDGREVEYGFLGVRPASAAGRFPPAFGADAGVEVAEVTAGGPADLAGLADPRRFGGQEVILAVDGNRVRDADDLYLSVGAALAGTPVALDVRTAGGGRRRLTATLAKLSHDLPRLASAPPPSAFGVRAEYASVGYTRHQWPTLPAGVFAAELTPAAAAAFAAAAPAPAAPDAPRQWVVSRVDGKPVGDPRAFAAACAGKPGVTLTAADAARPDVTFPVTLP